MTTTTRPRAFVSLRCLAVVALGLIGGVTLLPAADVVGATAANAVVPGELRVTPTIQCVGLYWPLKGDANGNAAATVEFQEAGTNAWKQAMPLWRVVPQAVDVQANTVG